jgi:acetyl-CoA synthetase
VLTSAPDYRTLCARFRWQIRDRFNLAHAVCDRHADGSNRLALIEARKDGAPACHGFDDLARRANRLANALRAAGVKRGDRIGILLGQRVETLLGHLASAKLGAIAVPLFTLFGPEALAFRLADSGAAALITDREGADRIAPLRPDLPDLMLVLAVDGAPAGTLDFERLLARASDRFEAVDTAADDPAVIIYTSGTTSTPKGALHGHRLLLGHLPGVQWPHDFFPQAGDRFWTPADWAWIGGLFDVLMPSLYFGVPVVAARQGRFDPEAAIDLMARHEVKNVFFPPTALRLLRRAGIDAAAKSLQLRSLASGGERLGDDVIAWGETVFGLTINEFSGQTEANLVIGNNARVLPRRAGSMGRAIPGHEVRIIDEAGMPLAPGETGEIAIRRPDPVMFLGYWRNPAATAAKFTGDWLRSGDLGTVDEAGYFTFRGRTDDVINSAGYRIGPAEIETCLAAHPAVALAAVIGVPDAIRGEIVKACIVLQPDQAPSDALAAEIQEFVKKRLAAHEYPREIAFMESLPLTATGKVRRRDLRAASGREDAGAGAIERTGQAGEPRS